MKTIPQGFLAILVGISVLPSMAAAPRDKPSFGQYLKEAAVLREVIDRFLQGPSWAQYDPGAGLRFGEL